MNNELKIAIGLAFMTLPLLHGDYLIYPVSFFRKWERFQKNCILISISIWIAFLIGVFFLGVGTYGIKQRLQDMTTLPFAYCTECGTKNTYSNYCTSCGNKLSTFDFLENKEDKRCFSCGRHVDKENVYCETCGATQNDEKEKKKCNTCETYSRKDAKFCQKCGHSFGNGGAK